MENYQYMMSVGDVARELNCSKSHAYKLVNILDEMLKKHYKELVEKIFA